MVTRPVVERPLGPHPFVRSVRCQTGKRTKPARRLAFPSGHSLPELIVAVTFLAATLVAVGGTAVLGSRWTHRGARVQAAVRVAEGVLDSLAAVPEAGSGAGVFDGLRVSWSVEERAIRVEVSTPDGLPLAVLDGGRLPAVPVLPDAGASGEDDPGAREGVGGWSRP